MITTNTTDNNRRYVCINDMLVTRANVVSTPIHTQYVAQLLGMTVILALFSLWGFPGGFCFLT